MGHSLDEILRSLAHQAYLTAHAPGYTKLDGRTYKTAVDEAKQVIAAYTNKQIEQAYSDGFGKASKGAFRSQQAAKREAVEEVLDRLENNIRTGMVKVSVLDYIEAERIKLKGTKYV